jgi:mono/diheme cytochrome c family protein
VAAGIVLAAGVVDFSASAPPGRLEQTFARFALDRSIAHHATGQANPLAGSPGARRAGLVLFRDHCIYCHGAPGVDPAEEGASLNPVAPGLTLPRVQRRSDSELQWILEHGIRMTGMPTFGPTRSKEEIWQLVAALRALPKLTAEERVLLSSPLPHAGR